LLGPFKFGCQVQPISVSPISHAGVIWLLFSYPPSSIDQIYVLKLKICCISECMMKHQQKSEFRRRSYGVRKRMCIDSLNDYVCPLQLSVEELKFEGAVQSHSNMCVHGVCFQIPPNYTPSKCRRPIKLSSHMQAMETYEFVKEKKSGRNPQNCSSYSVV
jgi:hypothetical protein